MPPSDYIQRVAIVGATGHVGTHFTQELVKTGKHTVTALVRKGSTGTIASGATRTEVDFENQDSLVAALAGQQFLVITLSARAPSETHASIIKAAAKAGVSYVMPNVYGGDFRNEEMMKEDLYSAGALERCNDVANSGMSYVAMVCGFWYEWSLALGSIAFGIDIKTKKAIFYDDGQRRLPVSTWPLCGQALAKLLSLPESGAEPSLEQWKNGMLCFASFHVNQREMLDSVHRVLGDSDADWEIQYESSKERYEKGLADMANGDHTGFARALYARPFYPNGGGDFKADLKLNNEILGLPEEKLDDATRTAVDMVQSGWQPFP
ncbi:uncharacterized protein F5Z01DRAFT_725698 [Emericellopsis atlantica]|uniref:NAD(P)-binding domain-containing protein n=1 Tax=Emericellopsis atlantica TaxID=2614577 RepID=A0A9P7ZJB8_9HYPO|nr:uncharacterized protein F5Z01DRAFT_725698 [Emericellopsis atlantica]KAG9252986.1 hypothetical protein F5Z01DRAFT_725698 [Emericellopsis atlantica]